MLILAVLGLLGLGAVTLLLSFIFRRVVATNEVHIVQSAKTTTSYGKDTKNGNTYYEIPSWVPRFGITKIVLPVSVFDLDLKSYEAYDQGRVPFVIDITSFFRISDSDLAAQRVSSFEELLNQLKSIVQGAARTILASHDIEEIMQGRSKFGQAFTEEVEEQLKSWGVSTVKNIELMDIRDANGSQVIHNIMAKKQSLIEKESRQEVAKNKQAAKIAEIDAQKEVDLQAQIAKQAVGLRTVEAEKEVEVATQAKEQSIKEQVKLTKEKEMAVAQVEHVRAAEIKKQVNIVAASQEKEATILKSEGLLRARELDATAIRAVGTAEADAKKLMELAPISAQIELAKEIGSNEDYQKYLIAIENIKAVQAVGMEQAKALEKADVKIISNSNEPVEGLSNVMDLFSAKGGVKVGAMVDALKKSGVDLSSLLGKDTSDNKDVKSDT